MRLEFRLLGDVALFVDGQPLDLGGTRQRSVFALLVLQRNRPVSTETLATRLWPDEQPLTALKTIQVYVSRIRRALGPDAERLTSTPTGYRLAVADDELDAARFERGLRLAREARASVTSATSLARLEEAIAFWSGPALSDLAGEPFGRREAERLEELRVQAFEELFELQIGSGNAREAIGELRRLLGDQPGRERLWRLLMLALYADGRQGEALEAYQDARRYLADELGLDPSPELQELERAILNQEATRPALTELAAAGHAINPTTLSASITAEPETIGRRTRRVVTVLRADIIRTSANASLDPEVLQARERRTYDVIRTAVERHGGTIDQDAHDGVTAVFGLTAAREDDSLRAVRAAVELRGDAAHLDDADSVLIRVGVATGEVLASPSVGHRSTISGVPVQVAARLAAQAAPREVLLAQETEQLVRAVTLTQEVPFETLNDPPGSSAVRLVKLTDGDAIVRRTGTRFVGRDAEFGTLLAAFDRVKAEGKPGLVTVVGAPGVGKSRLVAEFFAQTSNRARILRSRCLPYGDGITYRPVRELVIGAAGIESGEPRDEARTKLDAILAGFDRGDLVSSRIASIVGLSDDPATGEEIPWAVRRFFEALAAERPLVVFVDDIQWAEPALLDLLEHVVDLGRGRILVVTVARPELEELHPELLARPGLNLIRLDALSEADASTLLDHLAPELPSGQLRSRILATAEGNPLFVEQFVAYASDEAAGQRLHDRTAADLPIPPTIGALLAARLDRLPSQERRTLAVAAVVGRTFWAGAIGELLPDGERVELHGRLARLARRELIRPDHSEFPDDEAYRFRHILIRDAAYAALPKDERVELHERFADWLERRTGNVSHEDLILGYHLEQAYRYRLELGDDGPGARQLADRALVYIAPAGQIAGERGDPHAAISLLRRAIDLTPLTRQRIELLIALRSALWTAGERQASDAIDSETAALLTEHPDQGLQHRRSLANAMYDAGQMRVPASEAAYAYYERAGDELGMIHALEVAMLHPAPVSVSLEQLDQATALAFAIGRPDRAATVAAKSAWLFPYSSVPVSDSLARLRRYLGWAGNNRFLQASILLHLGELEAMSGVRDRWRRHFDEAKTIIDDLGLVMPHGVFGYPHFLGTTELAAGEPARVVQLLLECCSILESLGDLGRLASVAPLTARTLLAVRRLDEVERYAFWGRDIADADDLDAHGQWRIAISGLRSLQGRHEEAVNLSREAVALLVDSDFVVLLAEAQLALAGALRAANDEPAAHAAAQEARRLAVSKENEAALRKIDAFLMSAVAPEPS